MGKIKCPEWSCHSGIVVGPYDHEWTCKACNGTGSIEGEEKPPEFEPAFDMPTTKEQALQCLEKWGNPTCATFSAARAKRMWELLTEPTPAVAVNEQLLEALRDFSNYVRTEQSSTDGHVQYSNTQINRLAFKARSAIAAAQKELDK